MSNRYNDITILYQNVRGLNTKTDEFFKSVSEGEYNLVAASETWIQTSVNSSELFNSNYITFRKDRNLNAINVSRGRGVLLGVRSDIKPTALDLSDIENLLPAVDVVGCKLVYNNVSFYVFAIYVQPNTPAEQYRRL